MNDDILKRLQTILAEALGFLEDEVQPKSRIWDDLDINQDDMIDLFPDIEAEFGVALEIRDLKGVKTIEDLVEVIDELEGE